MTYSNKEINRLTPTNEDTVGPYYPPSLCENNNSLDIWFGGFRQLKDV